MADVKAIPLTIASGDSISGALDLSPSNTLLGFFTPSAMTGDAISVLASPFSGASYGYVHDGNGSAVSKVIPTDEIVYIPFNPQDFVGVRYVKLVSDATEGSDRTLTAMVTQV